MQAGRENVLFDYVYIIPPIHPFVNPFSLIFANILSQTLYHENLLHISLESLYLALDISFYIWYNKYKGETISLKRNTKL